MTKTYDQMETIEDFAASGAFNDWQLQCIANGLCCGLGIEKIRLYADPKFSPDQMEQICEGFKNGRTLEEAKIYSDPKYDSSAMKLLQECFEADLPAEQRAFCIYSFEEKYNGTILSRLEEMLLGFQHGLSLEQVKSYADCYYSDFRRPWSNCPWSKTPAEKMRNARLRLERKNQGKQGFLDTLRFAFGK